MSDDIGPGDVVECVDDGPWRQKNPRRLRPPIRKGQRYLVLKTFPSPLSGKPALRLVNVTLRRDQCLLIDRFRKIGGSQADTIRRFSEDLNVKAPKVDA